MSERNTILRSIHDLSLATWLGGDLMGAVGLNGAVAQAKDPTERLRLSSVGWGRWTPVAAAAITLNAASGLGLVLGNKSRLAVQQEARWNTVAKASLSAVAAGLSIYRGQLAKKIGRMSHEGAPGVTEPGPTTSPELARAQRHLKIYQWLTPALLGAIVVLGSQQGEQQRAVAGLLGHRLNLLGTGAAGAAVSQALKHPGVTAKAGMTAGMKAGATAAKHPGAVVKPLVTAAQHPGATMQAAKIL
ncbi:MAG TPA: hypothetical protein VFL99_12225 [Segeticoccus sp.]|uniref:hypothetical protein n=1 Tax=Segeticoccus sp. TaxID=2706531 RepID=UPI002D7F46F7|nr:hypothetical protein [Segeticoccus sp.]HET8601086.1 hypothetical protein [Segeticoccus sp.]